MKFKLQKDKYPYKVMRLSVPEDSTKHLVRFIITESLSLTLAISSLLNVMGGVITKSWDELVLNSKYSLNGVKDRFDVMDELDKTIQVINSFYYGIDANKYLTDDQKQYLKEIFTPYLEDYGYLYNYDGLVNMQVVLTGVGLSYDEIEKEGISGYYYNLENRIVLDYEAGNDTLCHEILHGITIDNDINSLPWFVLEGVNSSFDLTYADHLSYSALLRSQIAMVSEIMGREEFMRCFVNADGASFRRFFEELDKDAYHRLCELTDEELNCMIDRVEYSNDKIIEIAEILRSMYEKQHNKSIKEDAIVNLIYMSCFQDSDYRLRSTMFYDDQFAFDMYMKDSNEVTCNNIIDICDRNTLVQDEQTDYSDLNLIARSRENVKWILSDYNNGINSPRIIFMKELFTEERFNEIINSDDMVDYLVEYFKNQGAESPGSLVNMVLSNYSEEYNLHNLCYIYLEKYNYYKENEQLHYAAADLNDLASRLLGVELNSEASSILYWHMLQSSGDVNFQNFSSFYWIDRDVDSYGNSVLGYQKGDRGQLSDDVVCLSVSTLINGEMDYTFFVDGVEVKPKFSQSVQSDGVINFYFSSEYVDKWIEVVGNSSKKTNYELGLENNNGVKNR